MLIFLCVSEKNLSIVYVTKIGLILVFFYFFFWELYVSSLDREIRYFETCRLFLSEEYFFGKNRKALNIVILMGTWKSGLVVELCCYKNTKFKIKTDFW